MDGKTSLGDIHKIICKNHYNNDSNAPTYEQFIQEINGVYEQLMLNSWVYLIDRNVTLPIASDQLQNNMHQQHKAA